MKGWHAGRALRQAREDDGLTVDQLAARLAEASGESWYGQKVSRIERGEQEAKQTDIALFRQVQGRPLEFYFDGPDPVNVRSAMGVFLSPAFAF